MDFLRALLQDLLLLDDASQGLRSLSSLHPWLLYLRPAGAGRMEDYFSKARVVTTKNYFLSKSAGLNRAARRAGR
jgi:hypothetical protein